jgi:hypothetical protein
VFRSFINSQVWLSNKFDVLLPVKYKMDGKDQLSQAPDGAYDEIIGSDASGCTLLLY